ncbi:unnamed protein product [Pleuronectes platessa]|uniref:Uncharacterized protein n=1 Tax=Pleuronectes platessa TaxID=8262 RepID=A0A9N7VWA8_PLEPL|nr:unnamed protein product [Pleuronectes platessa]
MHGLDQSRIVFPLHEEIRNIRYVQLWQWSAVTAGDVEENVNQERECLYVKEEEEEEEEEEEVAREH